MKRVGWTIVLLLIPVAIPALAQGVAIKSLSVDTPNIFVGDWATVTLTLYNPSSSAVKVDSIQITGYGVESGIYDIGYIPPQSSHEISIPVKATKPGVLNVEVAVFAENGTVRSYFTLFVEEKMPEVSFRGNVKLGEVNKLNLTFSSPFNVRNVVIDPLFDSEPDKIVLSSVSGVVEVPLKFYGENKSYEFSISFYSGNNYHSYKAVVNPAFESGSGLVVNISVPCLSAFLYDAVEIRGEITNLMDDAISSLKVSADSNNGKVLVSPSEIARVESFQSKGFTLIYSPERVGLDEITIKVSYKDALGNYKEITKSFSLEVLKETAVDVAGVSIESRSYTTTSQPSGPFRGATSSYQRVEITVAGEVVNRGFSNAKNVLVYLDFGGKKEEYFIGEVDPSQSESFSIPASGGERNVTVFVEWTNSIGEIHRISKTYQLSPVSVTFPQRQSSPFNYNIIIIAAIIALALGLTIYIRRRRRRNEGNRAN